MSNTSHGFEVYDGGKGCDTLVLELTSEQANTEEFLVELAAYEEFIAGNHGQHFSPFFKFKSIGLKARNWEKIEIFVIDEPEVPTISIADAPPAEEGQDLVFAVSLDQPALADVTVDYEIVLDGSASADDLALGKFSLYTGTSEEGRVSRLEQDDIKA